MRYATGCSSRRTQHVSVELISLQGIVSQYNRPSDADMESMNSIIIMYKQIAVYIQV
jgi:hypothetical protein